MWQPTHIQVTVQKAKRLICKGKNETNDAFVVIGLGKEKFQTSIKEKCSSDVEWHEECELTIPERGNTAAVKLVVYHRNSLGLDEFLGQVELPLNEFDVYERSKNRWYTLKGKPEKDKKKGEKDRGELEVKVAFTVKSGSINDVSKTDSKLKASHNSLKNLGGSLMSLGKKEKNRISKIGSSLSNQMHKLGKPGSKKKKKVLPDMENEFPNQLMSSSQRFGHADPGVISDEEDDDGLMFNDVKLNTQSSSPRSTLSRGSSVLQEHPEHEDEFRTNSEHMFDHDLKPPAKPSRLGALDIPFTLPSLSPKSSPSTSPKAPKTEFVKPKSPRILPVPKSPLLKALSSPNKLASVFHFPSNEENRSNDTASPDSAIGSSVAGDSSDNATSLKYISKSATLPLSRVVSSPPSMPGSQPGSPSSLMVGRAVTAVAAGALAPTQFSDSTRERSASVTNPSSPLSKSSLISPSISQQDLSKPRSQSSPSPSKDKVWSPVSFSPTKKKEQASPKPHVPKALMSIGNLSSAVVETAQPSPSPTSSTRSGSYSNVASQSNQSVSRSGSLSEKRSSQPLMDEWERKLFNRSGMVGSLENVSKSGSLSSLNTSRASSIQDISSGDLSSSRFPEVKPISIQEEGREPEVRKHKTGKREAFKDKLRSLAGAGSRERLTEKENRFVEGGNDRLPDAPIRHTKFPQEVHDQFAGKTREDLMEMILNLRASLEKQAKHTRDLEDYIDDLLLRVMETTPLLLQAPNKKNSVGVFGKF